MNLTLAVLIAALAALLIVHLTAPRRGATFHPDIYCYDPAQQDRFSGGVPGLCELKPRYA